MVIILVRKFPDISFSIGLVYVQFDTVYFKGGEWVRLENCMCVCVCADYYQEHLVTPIGRPHSFNVRNTHVFSDTVPYMWYFPLVWMGGHCGITIIVCTLVEERCVLPQTDLVHSLKHLHIQRSFYGASLMWLYRLRLHTCMGSFVHVYRRWC